MPDIKPTIVANIENALATGEKATPHEMRSEKILSSVKDSLKKLVTQGKSSFNRTKEKSQGKIFSSIKSLLVGIKKKLPDPKSGGILKFLIFMFAGILLKTVKSLAKVIALFVKGIGKLGLLLKKGFTLAPFKKLWKALTVISDGGRSGAKQLTRFGMAIEKFKFKMAKFGKAFGKIGKLFSGFGKLFSGFAKVGKLGVGGFFKTIFKVLKGFGSVFKLFAPLGRVLGKVLLPITILMGVIDGIKGLSKASEIFGKKDKEMLTIGEKASAIVGGIISGFTFGLLGSTEDMAKGIHKLFTKPKDFLKEDMPKILNTLGEKLITGLKKLGEWIIKGGKFIFGIIASIDWIGIITKLGDLIVKGIQKGVELFKKFFPIIIQKIKDVFASIDWATVGKTMFNIWWTILSNIIKILWTVFKELPSLLWTALQALTPLLAEVLASVGSLVWEGLKGLGGVLLDGLKLIFSEETLTKLSKIGSTIVNWGKKIISFLFDGIKKIFVSDEATGEKSIISKTIDALSGLKDKVLGGIKSFIMKIVDGIGSVLDILKRGAGKVVQFIKGLFSDNPSESDILKKAKATAIEDTAKAGGVVISETSTEAEKTKVFMDFLVTQFADVMAEKIAVAIEGGNVDSIKEPTIKIM